MPLPVLENAYYPRSTCKELAHMDHNPGTRSLTRYVGPAQAIYYIITSLWALAGIRSFQKVTGPKVDIWLVKTVGVLVGVIGAVIGKYCSKIAPKTY